MAAAAAVREFGSGLTERAFLFPLPDCDRKREEVRVRAIDVQRSRDSGQHSIEVAKDQVGWETHDRNAVLNEVARATGIAVLGRGFEVLAAVELDG